MDNKLNLLTSLTYDFSTAKECTVGRSCKLSCISKSNQCLEEFDEAMRPIVKALADRLSETYPGDVSETGKDRSNVLDSLKGEPNPNLLKLLDGKNDEEKMYWAKMYIQFTGAPRPDKVDVLTYSKEEAQGLVDNAKPWTEAYRKTLEAAGGSESGINSDSIRVQGGIRDMVNSKKPFQDIKDEDVELFFNALPDSITKGTLNGMGTPGGSIWKGDSLDTNKPPSPEGDSKLRSKLLTKVFLQQGGVDAYTGRPLFFQESELEHVLTLEGVGKTAEDPANWVFTRTPLNRSKGAKNPEDYYNMVTKSFKVKPGEQIPEDKMEAILKGGDSKKDSRKAEDAKKEVIKSKTYKDLDRMSESDFKSLVTGIKGKVLAEAISNLNPPGEDSDYKVFNGTIQAPASDKKMANPKEARVARKRLDWMSVGSLKPSFLASSKNNLKEVTDTDSIKPTDVFKGDTIESWTLRAWKKGNPEQRKEIESYWRKAPVIAQGTWMGAKMFEEESSLEEAKAKITKANKMMKDSMEETSSELMNRLKELGV